MYGKTTINTFRSGPEIYFVFSAYQSFQKWQLLVIICSRLAQILCRSGQDATCLRAVSDRLATSMDPQLNLYHLQTPFLEKKRERRDRNLKLRKKNKKIIYTSATTTNLMSFQNGENYSMENYSYRNVFCLLAFWFSHSTYYQSFSKIYNWHILYFSRMMLVKLTTEQSFILFH